MTTRTKSKSPSWMGPSKVLLFAAGGLPLGVPIEDMLRVVPEEDVLVPPMAHHALYGVMETREGVSPVYDLAALCTSEKPRRNIQSKEKLVAFFPHPLGSVGLRLDKLAGLAPDVVPLGESLQRNLQGALPAQAQLLVTGAATAKGQLFFFFSKDAFLGWVAEQAV